MATRINTNTKPIIEFSSDFTLTEGDQVVLVESAGGGGGGITNSAANNELMKSDGTNAVASGLESTSLGDLNLGRLATTTGTDRSISAAGSASNINLNLLAKGNGNTVINAGTIITHLNKLGINCAPDVYLDVYAITSETNTVVICGSFEMNSSGTVANGFGVKINFKAEHSGGSNTEIGGISAVFVDKTSGSEESYLAFNVKSAGAIAERLRLNNDGAIGINGANYGTAGQVIKSQGAGLPAVWGSGGTGDVVGPSSAVDLDIAQFDGTTGKLIKDGGKSISTDGTLASNSDNKVSTEKAVKTYVDNAVTGLLELKGSTDCSANPNYPAANKGDSYYVTVAGKIGGASGKSVDVSDVYVASADNAGGTEASVGTSWFVLEHNLVGALLAANNLSDLGNAGTARTNLGLGTAATQNTSAFLQPSNNLSDVSSTATTRTNLGLGTGDTPTLTGLLLSGETASRIASFDGSKNVKALDTATYPSLTEFSYGKGVTSPLQTQIDAVNVGSKLYLFNAY